MSNKGPDYIDLRDGALLRIDGLTVKQHLKQLEINLEQEIGRTLTEIAGRFDSVDSLLSAIVDGKVHAPEDLGNTSLFLHATLDKVAMLWQRRNKAAKLQDGLEENVIYLLSEEELEEYGF